MGGDVRAPVRLLEGDPRSVVAVIVVLNVLRVAASGRTVSVEKDESGPDRVDAEEAVPCPYR